MRRQPAELAELVARRTSGLKAPSPMVRPFIHAGYCPFLHMATRTTVQITLPAMGESVTEGTVLEWRKQVGDRVEADEPIVEVSTDKVDAEVPAPASGTLTAIHAQPDETVAVGAVLGEISVDDGRARGGNGSDPATAAPAAAESDASVAAQAAMES